MTTPSVLAGGPVQIAYGVDDVVEAAHRWAEHGAGPFFIREHIPVDVLGLATGGDRFDHSSAYGQWGALMVELVCVHDPPALAMPGLHHLAYFVDGHGAAATELDAAGFDPVLTARAGATTFSFHDARAELGHFVEIYEGSEALRSFYRMVADAAADWDGNEPVRLLG